ncbi:family 43 glycosylhydrolase [Dactylosporangium sp. CA-052675]|uniref:family 43 glycosylhydrolase n=1 Tax=Dactylosporangium sp. CA-052675 TaxID=3239927 RepID=UPI003D924921
MSSTGDHLRKGFRFPSEDLRDESIRPSATGRRGLARRRGHNGFFKSPDGTEDWMVYHANTSASGGCDMNRSTRAQKITWNSDGTPNLGVPAALSTPLAVPSGE